MVFPKSSRESCESSTINIALNKCKMDCLMSCVKAPESTPFILKIRSAVAGALSSQGSTVSAHGAAGSGVLETTAISFSLGQASHGSTFC